MSAGQSSQIEETPMRIEPEQIHRDETETKGRYSHAGPDGAEAELTYSRAGQTLIIIDHTSVPPSMRGTGAGQALVARAVADARATGVKVLPLCTFAAAQFRRHPDWADVLQDAAKARP
jgi:uncharacterized protein